MTSPRRKPKATLEAILVVTALGCGWFTATRLFGADDTRPGSADVYSRIEAETDCKILQGEFDTAEANHKQDLTRGAADLANIDASYMEEPVLSGPRLPCAPPCFPSPGPTPR